MRSDPQKRCGQVKTIDRVTKKRRPGCHTRTHQGGPRFGRVSSCRKRSDADLQAAPVFTFSSCMFIVAQAF